MKIEKKYHNCDDQTCIDNQYVKILNGENDV